ncbi:quinone oxidoreductase family protein [Paraburkholderia megapolitana]|uniref:NADPH2:quinone reductase n=1 Tax=Paraburkholderia megapolitana TaxID=420953 RepID=A0A1I3T3Q5_9BURK|nr:quinone oxidoreductase [Paraburkholderia megapolitana]QDQ81403.1 quinone oxidoreductase [Paraburkholderia megapolitana]SFJ65142.1 NADPH2:quinone reductase [Paraburkholderia megapolitana]
MGQRDAYQIGFEAYGDAGVLRMFSNPVPAPAAGEVQIRQTAVGVNFVDVYFRSGLYRLPQLPAVPGVEAAGVVEAVGLGVDGIQTGQRVVYGGMPPGSYTNLRNLPADRVLPVPDGISYETAAAALLRGVTSWMLLRRVRELKPGDTLLVHAAAGGLGLILVQWAKSLGARVIGTVGSREKAALALAHGLDQAVLYRDEDFVEAAREFGGGAGVDYAVDGIGGDTLRRTLGAVKPFGMVASVGQVAGEAAPVSLDELGPARSIALARPSVLGLMRDTVQYQRAARETLDRVAGGLHVEIGERLALQRAADAHRRMETGATTGSVILIP